MEKNFEYDKISKQKFEELQKKIEKGQDILVLGIESSCDETSVAVVKNGRQILSNIIATQIPIHKRFGGVVPEVASRNHILAIDNVFEQALVEANIEKSQIDAIAVTYGAGLVGALLVGVNFAKSLAFSLGLPLIAVSHINGHICANYLTHAELKPPFMCLMVSGGHTAILQIPNYTEKIMLGTTIDDAVGEAFDKVARVLGLNYPGGVEIQNLAMKGESNLQFIKHNSMKDTLNFSFSGIKTAIINYVHNCKQKNIEFSSADVCASFQKFATDELSSKALRACVEKGEKNLVIAGGVGANLELRRKLTEKAKELDINVFYPELKLCTDNAAMIASSGFYSIMAGKDLADLSLTAKPTVAL